MTFVVTDSDRERSKNFSQLLLSTFSGCIIYLYRDPMDVIDCVRDHQVDAVFIEAVMEEMEGVQLLLALRERHPDLPAFILADDDEHEDEAMWNDATDYLIRPVSGEKLLELLQPAQTQDV